MSFFTLHFKFWRYFLWKFVKYNHQIFYFLCFYFINFYISRYFSRFSSQIFLFKRILSTPPTPPPLPHLHLNGQNPLSMKKVFCRCFLTNLFFETQTNLNSSSSNSNSFYILRSHTIADKCILVKDLRVNFFNSVSSSPPSFLSQL